jgi:hypothetical protein
MYVLTVHGLKEPREDCLKVVIEVPLIIHGLPVGEEVPQSPKDESADQMMLLNVIETTLHKEIKCGRVLEDYLRHELRELVVHKADRLSNLWHGVIDHLNNPGVGVRDNRAYLVRVWAINDRAEGNHADVAVAPVGTLEFGVNEV